MDVVMAIAGCMVAAIGIIAWASSSDDDALLALAMGFSSVGCNSRWSDRGADC